jgi:hypothetical protein
LLLLLLSLLLLLLLLCRLAASLLLQLFAVHEQRGAQHQFLLRNRQVDEAAPHARDCVCSSGRTEPWQGKERQDA